MTAFEVVEECSYRLVYMHDQAANGKAQRLLYGQ